MLRNLAQVNVQNAPLVLGQFFTSIPRTIVSAKSRH
jgi:hypothetical protein